MPQENRRRGRREEQKRKRDEVTELDVDEEEQAHLAALKRHKIANHELQDNEYVQLPPEDGYAEEAFEQDREYSSHPGEIPFYGMLDEEEQAYFKRADSMLELNQFENAEERDLFVESVYREAAGKELKIANSQACSRFLERLILMSNPKQLKGLFQKFIEHFLHLVQHRFASHCCEALFIKCAPLAAEELIHPPEHDDENTDEDMPYVSMEDLFLQAIKELEGNLGYLMTDRFASHSLRVLLVVLSGRPLKDASTNSILQSKKKEKIDIISADSQPNHQAESTRSVPESFTMALEALIQGSVAGLDTNYLRALATQPIGNPVLQLLLDLEFQQSGKSKAKDSNSIFRKLLPDDPIIDGTESATFMNNLLYDSVGSHLLETIIQNAPGKTFKIIYKGLYKEKLASLARNETAGFVIIKMLERFSKEELQDALDKICPIFDTLIERKRTSIIKTLVERCQVRHVPTGQLALAIQASYGVSEQDLLLQMLDLDAPDAGDIATERKVQMEVQDSSKRHSSLLAQAMLDMPGPLHDLIANALLALNATQLLNVAKGRTTTHVLQKAFTNSEHSNPLRRKLVQRLLGNTMEMARDPIASHVVDALWPATDNIFFLREKIANTLAENEVALRESYSGRNVWRNWMMDLFTRRRTEWIAKAKGDQIRGTASVSVQRENQNEKGKSAIQLARERHAAQKGAKPFSSQNSRTALVAK
ncbi:Nucleolar protein 9 [Agyrium rufum]|nr:Nucleolar protein 9 [Agyrium rufum]